MRTPRIYYPETLSLGDYKLSTEAHNHLVVLRVKVNDEIALFNGLGGEYHAVILEHTKKQTLIKISSHEPIEREATLPIHLGQCLIKNDRMDYAIQKAVELGVKQITPLISDYCNLKQNKALFEKKHFHYQKIVQSAAEQCGRNTLPVVHPITFLKEWVEQLDEHAFHIALEPTQSQTLKSLKPNNHELTLTIGPEGGFSPQEVEQILCKPFHTISIGSRILRAETATVVALTAVQTIWGDLT